MSSTGLPAAPASSGPGPCRPDRPAVDGEQQVAGGDLGAGRGQRRARPRIGGLPRTILVIRQPSPVRSRSAPSRPGLARLSRPPAGAYDVGVRGAKLAERPRAEHVGESTEWRSGRAAAGTRPRGVPVHVGHVRHPEIVPHDPARLRVGLAPQRRRVGRNLARVGRRSIRSSRIVGVGLALGRHDGELAVIADDEPGAVAAGLEPVHLVGELAHLRVWQSRSTRAPGAARRRPAARRRSPRLPVTGSRSQARPPSPRAGREYRASGTGSATTRSASPVDVHRHRPHLRPVAWPPASSRRQCRQRSPARRPGRRRSPVRLVPGLPIGRPPSCGREGRRRCRRQRQQVRPGPVREAQVEEVRVVDGVEVALGQEGQVVPSRVNDRVGVDEPAVGDVGHLAVGEPGQPQPAQRARSAAGCSAGCDQASQAESGRRPAR